MSFPNPDINYRSILYITEDGVPDNNSTNIYTKIRPLEDIGNTTYHSAIISKEVNLTPLIMMWYNEMVLPNVKPQGKQRGKPKKEVNLTDMYNEDAKKIFKVNNPTIEHRNHAKWLHVGLGYGMTNKTVARNENLNKHLTEDTLDALRYAMDCNVKNKTESVRALYDSAFKHNPDTSAGIGSDELNYAMLEEFQMALRASEGTLLGEKKELKEVMKGTVKIEDLNKEASKTILKKMINSERA